MNIDVDGLIEIVREAGRVEIVPRFRNLEASDIGQKASDIDLVTQADIGAELHITAALRALYPSAMILGEEAYAADKSVMSGLAEAELAFVIDPVDGTFNFAAGIGLFGTLLAVTRRGETVAGIICDPLQGDVLVAERGSGAFMRRLDGQSRRIAVAPPVSLDQMIGAMTSTYMREPLRTQVGANLAKTRLMMSYGCSAYEYWMVATGRVHFAGHQYLMPWDHLAGVLVHQEAGGHTAKFDGSPYRPGETAGGIISAPDRESWDVVRREIIGTI
ncbi:inositol monophosphatase [Devosia sp.]|uniref:inositol monophosphatase family protein n=1 Tax=Devosia sp. TaxID=1871048 RepID=UPI003263CD6B